jgi:AraC-like DNA-binding protein
MRELFRRDVQQHAAAAAVGLVPPTLRPAQDREIRRMHDNGDYNVAEIAALFGISPPTVYRSLERTTALPPLPA